MKRTRVRVLYGEPVDGPFAGATRVLVSVSSKPQPGMVVEGGHDTDAGYECHRYRLGTITPSGSRAENDRVALHWMGHVHTIGKSAGFLGPNQVMEGWKQPDAQPG